MNNLFGIVRLLWSRMFVEMMKFLQTSDPIGVKPKMEKEIQKQLNGLKYE